MRNSARIFRARKALAAYQKAMGGTVDEADLRDCITDLLHLHASMSKKSEDRNYYDTEQTAMVALRAWKVEQ